MEGNFEGEGFAYLEKLVQAQDRIETLYITTSKSRHMARMAYLMAIQWPCLYKEKGERQNKSWCD